MNRKSLKELKELILKDIEHSKNFLENEDIKKSQNPQVIVMKLKEKARLEAMEDVLGYVERGEQHWFNK